MIFKESSNVTYALYQCVEEKITLDNIDLWVKLMEKNGFIYYQVEDMQLINYANEYSDLMREGKEINLDVVRFNHIFAVVKKHCANYKKGRQGYIHT